MVNPFKKKQKYKFKFLKDEYYGSNLPIEITKGKYKGTVFSFTKVEFSEKDGSGFVDWGFHLHKSKFTYEHLYSDAAFRSLQFNILMDVLEHEQLLREQKQIEDTNTEDRIVDSQESGE